nr:histidine kinase [Bacteroidota bacterium]
MGYAQNNIGQIFLKTNQIDSAVFYFEKCLAIGQKINNNDFILNSYLNLGAAYDIKKDFKRALEFFNQGIEKAKKVGDSIAYMGCLEGVAEANFYLKNYTTAISYCNDALLIAKKYNKLVNQRECYLMLSDMYNEKREFDKSLEAYKNFIQVRDSIINQEVKSEIVKKEMQYEFDKKEALLKSENDKKELIASAEIIRQRTVKNSAIVGATILLFAAFTSFAFYNRRRDALEQNTESDFMAQVSDTEMKGLRAQMNPHFIFNSLNSIGDYISHNENKVADNYLSKFAKLMRKILENSEQKEISISDDLQALELYMQLESMRLDNKFTYEIKVDENIDIENTLIPPLLLQPFVENSIWHGIAHKQGAGKISIEIKKDGEMISCVVEDNGIGRQTIGNA